MLNYRLGATLLILLSLCGALSGRRNVLFFVVDDLRPSLGAYSKDGMSPSRSDPVMYTPNIDRLAERSLVLNRSYVSQAICSPSRTSLLTSRRPDTTRVWDLKHYWRKEGGNFTTLPQYFKENGYRSMGMGKIFHPGKKASDNNDPISWTDPYFLGEDYYSPNHLLWQAVTPEEEKEVPLIDTQIADHALKSLKEAAPKALSGEQPFFIAVGFHKPHTPWNYPERFGQYYPLEALRVPDNYFTPINMPFVAWHNFSRLGTYKNVVENFNLHDVGAINYTFPKNLTLLLRKSYYSSISFTDYNIGRVLGQLESLGLANNTIVSFWGDHGWQLGEHCEWQKETNFELAARAPMMVSVPGITDKGSVTSQLVEFVDLFPTLVDLAGLPKMELCPENSSDILVCTEGKSFSPLFINPDKTLKKAAFSQFPHGGDGRNRLDYMGYTMRTERWRYTEWPKFRHHLKPHWHELKGVELYDHVIDPEENYNVADDPKYKEIRKVLSERLRAGWRHEMY